MSRQDCTVAASSVVNPNPSPEFDASSPNGLSILPSPNSTVAQVRASKHVGQAESHLAHGAAASRTPSPTHSSCSDNHHIVENIPAAEEITQTVLVSEISILLQHRRSSLNNSLSSSPKLRERRNLKNLKAIRIPTEKEREMEIKKIERMQRLLEKKRRKSRGL